MAKNNGTTRGVFERKKGSGIWCIRYVDQDGRLHREVVGPKGLAKALYEKRKTAIREAKFFPEQIGRQKVVLFAELVADFLAYSETNKRSYRSDKGKAQPLLTAFGTRPAKAITTQEIEGLKKTLRKTRGPATVDLHLALLRAIFNYGVDITTKVQHNPFKGVKLFQEDNARVRYLDEDEENRLFKALPTRYHDLVEVDLYTGLRASNLFGLEWANVDLALGVYTVPHTKSKKTLRQKMHSRVREILASLPRNGSPYVFPGAKKGTPRRDINHSFRKAVLKAGIVDFHFHDLRHTWASRLAMAGVPLHTIMVLGGWKTLRMVQRYAHLSPDHLQEALERLKPRRTGTSTDTREKSPSAERSGEPGNDATSLGPDAGVDLA